MRPADLRAAEPFEAVQREAAEILTGRIIVGHSISNDLQVSGPLQQFPCFSPAEQSSFAGLMCMPRMALHNEPHTDFVSLCCECCMRETVLPTCLLSLHAY